MSSSDSDRFQKGKKTSIDQMWNFIEEFFAPCDSVPDKKSMNDQQILKLYAIIIEADEMFKMFEQIAELKKGIDDLTKRS